MTARDIRYGRRGGGWAADNGTGDTLVDLERIRRKHRKTWPELLDQTLLFTPETVCATRAHEQQCAGRHPDGEPCTAVPTAADVAAVWAGRARMAEARVAAGRPLDANDRRALDRARTAEGAA